MASIKKAVIKDLVNGVGYWKKRCELAEDYIKESPCDPDIYEPQLEAWEKWQEFKKEGVG